MGAQRLARLGGATWSSLSALAMEPVALGRQSEDLADHRGLLRVHLADDVLPPAIGSLDLDVIVAVDAAARDVPGPGLSLEGVVGALPRAIALGLVGEGGHAHKQLVSWRGDAAGADGGPEGGPVPSSLADPTGVE